MSRTVTLELSEAMAVWLETSAHERGMSPTDWIILTLTEKYRLQHDSGFSEGSALITSSPAPAPPRCSGRANESHSEEVRERFRGHFGRLNSTDSHSADNERSDDDLARAYAEIPKDKS